MHNASLESYVWSLISFLIRQLFFWQFKQMFCIEKRVFFWNLLWSTKRGIKCFIVYAIVYSKYS